MYVAILKGLKMFKRYDSDDDDYRDSCRDDVLSDDMRSVTRRISESEDQYQRRLIDVRFNMMQLRGYL